MCPVVLTARPEPRHGPHPAMSVILRPAAHFHELQHLTVALTRNSGLSAACAPQCAMHARSERQCLQMPSAHTARGSAAVPLAAGACCTLVACGSTTACACPDGAQVSYDISATHALRPNITPDPAATTCWEQVLPDNRRGEHCGVPFAPATPRTRWRAHRT